jgi:hypothetical protein
MARDARPDLRLEAQPVPFCYQIVYNLVTLFGAFLVS